MSYFTPPTTRLQSTDTLATAHENREHDRDVFFRILGPLQATIRGKILRIGRNRQLIILAVLLINGNKVVPVSTLIDAVWSAEPPATADKQIQTCVWRLRNAFASAGAPADLVETEQGGYRIRLSDDDLDAHLFERAVQRARDLVAANDLVAASAEYDKALSMFHGQPFADLPSPIVQAVAARWKERSFSVLEERLDVQLALGHHAELISELKPLVAEYPLRERLHAQLMTALYLSQRRAEALAVYRNSRLALVNNLGLEPGARLQDLHRRIIAGEPLAQSQHHRVRQVSAKTPEQLPADVADFTGRYELLDRIGWELRSGEGRRVVALVGAGGIGKTTLAVHVGHQVREHFPDGQLYADLRGSTAPVPPEEVLYWFLDALGVPEQRVPDARAGRAALFRSLIANKRLLIVLDDVPDVASYEALLPNGESAVLCTARTSILEIPGVREHRVGGLAPAEGVELLTSLIGAERVSREPVCAKRIVELCGCFPLAIRASAARLRARPAQSLARFLDRLRDERERVAELSIGALDQGARLASTIEQLSPAGRELWLGLSLCDLRVVPEFVASAVCRSGQDHQRLLDELVNHQVIDVCRADEPTDGLGYVFNPLVRVYARQRAAAELGTAACAWIADRITRTVLGMDVTCSAPRPRTAPDHVRHAGHAMPPTS
ncbi:AfsR/SARP family transcriptional regulator [Umezawaea beigongshangensis]|uniref:AfsR/SARP family transcriptional regulator n=1 Tax=Umezawaea beigongshangensis TaxID=2780383 RepID=UPI0027DB9F61|nr:BTAD domain-containing putative transcriptional regulator [Umezawaea beigongshangensis]